MPAILTLISSFISQPFAAVLIAAELIFVLSRNRGIVTLIKSRSQRTDAENKQIDRGLRRAILTEALLFVPASAALVTMVEPLVMPKTFRPPTSPEFAYFSTLGVASYGFPFVTLKSVVARIAMTSLREFASITGEKPEEAGP